MTLKPGGLGDRLDGPRDVADRVPDAGPPSIPASSAALHVSSSRCASAEIDPTGNVQAESATNPSSVTPTSTERMSPSSSFALPGMPWTTIAFGERQVAAG